jgi:hypothetical protein
MRKSSPQILTTRFDAGGCDLAQIAAVMQPGVGNPRHFEVADIVTRSAIDNGLVKTNRRCGGKSSKSFKTLGTLL